MKLLRYILERRKPGSWVCPSAGGQCFNGPCREGCVLSGKPFSRVGRIVPQPWDEPPRVTPIGNLNDRLADVCQPHVDDDGDEP